MSYMSNINKGLPFVWHKTVFKLLYFNDIELLFTQHFWRVQIQLSQIIWVC